MEILVFVGNKIDCICYQSVCKFLYSFFLQPIPSMLNSTLFSLNSRAKASCIFISMIFSKKQSIYHVAILRYWKKAQSSLILPSKDVSQVAAMLSVIFVTMLESICLPVAVPLHLWLINQL